MAPAVHWYSGPCFWPRWWGGNCRSRRNRGSSSDASQLRLTLCASLKMDTVNTLRLNPFAPGRFEQIFSNVIFKLILAINDWRIFCKILIKWLWLDLTDDKSTLVQVMASCRQATSHYLSQCWPTPMSPYDVARPRWVNKITGFLPMTSLAFPVNKISE